MCRVARTRSGPLTGGVGDVLAGVVDRGDHRGEFVGMGCGDG
jgi:hypothetical protein